MNDYRNVPEKYEHQKEALSFIEDKNVFALFMEQGTGKTKVAIEKSLSLFIKDKINCLIVISPNAVKEQWIQEQFPEHCYIHNWIGFVWEGLKTKKSKKEFEDSLNQKDKLFIFSVNVEAFQSDRIDQYLKIILTKFDPNRIFIVIDESTRIKNGRRKPKKGKRAGAKRTNKILDFFHNVSYKAIMTGTPTPRSPFDLWSQFEFLQKDFFGMDYFYFQHRYGIMIKRKTNEGRQYNTTLDEKTYNIIKYKLNKFEKLTPQIVEEIAFRNGLKTQDIILISKMKKYSSYKNLEELKNKIEPITFFKKKKDCLDLPDKVYEKLYCVMGKEQSRIYKDLKKKLYAEYLEKEINVTSKLVMTLRLQMITGGIFPYSHTDIKLNKEGEEYFDSYFDYEYILDGGKIKTLLEDLEEVSSETSIIIWANFRGEIDLIYKKLSEAGYSCGRYYGGSSIDIVEQFKHNLIKVLIANPLKGGEGLNLQISTLHYFYSNSFKADSRLQAEDRSHRIGQTNKVTYKDLICKETIDEKIYNILKRKENLIDYFRSGGSPFGGNFNDE